jgi:hypothetical protein
MKSAPNTPAPKQLLACVINPEKLIMENNTNKHMILCSFQFITGRHNLISQTPYPSQDYRLGSRTTF